LFRTLSSTPDLYLDELRLELEATLGTAVSLSTIWRTLKDGGFTMKKVSILFYNISFILRLVQLSKIAIERSAERRSDYLLRIGGYEPNQIVFVDESAVDRRTTYRGRAYAIKGRKATHKAFFCQGRRYVQYSI
jgi:hypothetical protein